MTDYLILGGGSAGCVLAARLCEDPQIKVMLVEAGPSLTLETMAPHVRSRYPGQAYFDPGNIWSSLTAYMGAPLGNTDNRQPRRYEQGRLLGGGSAVNAMVANRGAPGDYDEWGALGADGWNWDAALPYFKKLERDVDFDGEYHGKTGPIPIRRIRPDRMRTTLIHNVVTLGIKLETLLNDDKALTDFVAGGVGGVWHASGTARMGRADDPLAVTDGAGRVYGVEGLRIVDASLMPSIPRANTNTPTIMMAERIADLIKAARRG